jgi:hypothetical protein
MLEMSSLSNRFARGVRRSVKTFPASSAAAKKTVFLAQVSVATILAGVLKCRLQNIQ